MVVLAFMFCQAIVYFITIVEVCKKKNLVQVNPRRKNQNFKYGQHGVLAFLAA